MTKELTTKLADRAKRKTGVKTAIEVLSHIRAGVVANRTYMEALWDCHHMELISQMEPAYKFFSEELKEALPQEKNQMIIAISELLIALGD